MAKKQSPKLDEKKDMAVENELLLPIDSVDVTKLVREYNEANSELTNRIEDKRFGYNNYDKLYNAYIDPARWPYGVKLSTPRGFTAIFHKTVRMIGGRFTGRIEGVEKNDEVGAKIATEHFKWSVERFNQYSDKPFEALAAQWDTNTRLYGAGFLHVFWKTEYKQVKVKGKLEKKKVYDGWWAEVLNNRDVLLQPNRETVTGSDYVIIRRYASLEALERVQEDGAGFDEASMNVLKEAKTGAGKDANYVPFQKTIKGLSGTDDRFEYCVTKYKDKWVTWCPKQGSGGKKEALILRVIKNPYRHQQINVVPLVYLPSEESIIGMGELQPVAALLKILSALQSQFIEQVNIDLYPPTIASATESRIDTFKFKPKAIWLANNPQAITKLQGESNSLNKFSEAYKMIVTEFLEAMGETGQGISQNDLLGAGDKTATEVRDRSFLRNARDNFNKLMLSAALKRVMYLIFEMIRDPQFTDRSTVIKVVGKEALEYFDKQGFSSWGINDQGYELVIQMAEQLNQDPELKETARAVGQDIFDLAYDILSQQGTLDAYAEPMEGATDSTGNVVPKMEKSDDNTGYLSINPEDDYLGEFNFIPDVEALGMPDSQSDYAARASWYQQAKETEQSGALQADGYKLKHKDILSKLGELAKIKEADQYFEKADMPPQMPGGMMNGTEQGGISNAGAGPQGQISLGGQPVPAPNPGVQSPVGSTLPPTQ